MSDLIDRQQTIEAICMETCGVSIKTERCIVHCTEVQAVEKLPSAQPDIIRCRNCKFASGDSRICMKFGHSPIGELDFCAWAERRTDERTD